jgi:hypothetical protein
MEKEKWEMGDENAEKAYFETILLLHKKEGYTNSYYENVKSS